MTLALLSAVAYAGVDVYGATREAALAPIVTTIGAFGALLLAFVLVRGNDDLLGWTLGLGGAAYAIGIVAHGSHVDEAAPLVAVALLLCGELAAWSLDERRPIAAERGIVAGRVAALGVLALAGLGAAALVVALAATSLGGGGLVWTALGAVAAVLVVAAAGRLSTVQR